MSSCSLGKFLFRSLSFSKINNVYNNLGAVLIALLMASFTKCQVSFNLTVTGSCASQPSLKTGDYCTYQGTIQLSANSPTDLYLSITSMLSTNIYAQICPSSLTIGSNYNISAVTPVLTTTLSQSQVRESSNFPILSLLELLNQRWTRWFTTLAPSRTLVVALWLQTTRSRSHSARW